MLAIALALCAILAVWAMYKAIVYALPCLLGWGAASVAISSGAGWLGAVGTGLVAAASSFYVLRILLAKVRSSTLRSAIAVVLTLPSAVIGYNVAIDALTSSEPTELWRRGVALVFALTVSAIAFIRMTEFGEREQ